MSISSREQLIGIDQVAQARTQLEEATQQNAALVEESAAAAESMREQATVPSQLVSRFTADETSAQVAPSAKHVRPAPRAVVALGSRKLNGKRKRLTAQNGEFR